MIPINEKSAMTQPVPIPQMTLQPQNRNMRNLPLDKQGKRSWSFGLFKNLQDINKCCLACWCPCISHAQIKKRLEHLNKQGVPDPQPNDVTMKDCLPDVLLDLTCGLGWILQINTRKNIRERYNIRGSQCSDCCTPFCCQSCNLVQSSRELQLEEESFEAGNKWQI